MLRRHNESQDQRATQDVSLKSRAIQFSTHISIYRVFLLAGLLLMIQVTSGGHSSLITRPDEVIDGKFIKVGTGIRDTASNVEVIERSPPNSSEYRFQFRPSVSMSGSKSRLELNTCFLTNESTTELSMEDQNYLTLGTETFPSRVHMLCNASIEPIDAVHTYKYSLTIQRDAISEEANYILSQWHGSPDPRIMADSSDNPCFAKISDEDLKKMCEAGKCKQGVVKNANDTDTGLRYQQGGYPPLTLRIKKGKFDVTARSDDRLLIPKGGCNKLKHGRRCVHHPHQQMKTLWKKPLHELDTNKLNFEWRIKWSEYGFRKLDDNTTEGVLLSNAWIRLKINKKEEINWKGPCGRNDDGRVPYFKFGIYVPTGNTYAINFTVDGYRHKYRKVSAIKSGKFRRVLGNLKIPIDESTLREFTNTNHLVEGTAFNFARDDETQCQLETT